MILNILAPLQHLIYLECSHDNLFVNFITDEELSEGFSFLTRDGRFLKTDSANATYEKEINKNDVFRC